MRRLSTQTDPNTAPITSASSNARLRWREFLGGARAELPILLGVIPFGMIYGALAVGSGLSAVAAQAMSSIVFAGSAQFITAQLIAQATPWFVIILTAAIVNLRHMLYSASMAPYVQHLPMRWKAGLAYLLTDEAYAMAITRFHQPDRGGAFGHWYVLGAGLMLWVTWQLSTAIGIVAGALVPSAWSLDFALPLTFIAIVVPALKDRPAIAAALVAGVMSVLVFNMPLKLSIVVATLCGIAAGLMAEGVSGWAASRDPRSSLDPDSEARNRAEGSGDSRNVPDPSSLLRGSEVGDRGKKRDRGDKQITTDTEA